MPENKVVGYRPGEYWCWTSFQKLCPRIATIVTLGNQHAPNMIELRTNTESYLTGDVDRFPVIVEKEETLELLDGCYVMYDSVRRTFIKAGMASETFSRRLFKEHPKNAMLNTPIERTRRFYLKYPKQVSAHKVPDGVQRGVWEDLEMRLGIGMSKQHKQQILQMFEWDEIDEHHLTKLKYSSSGGGTLVDKRWKHLCYCFETFMAVAIAPGDNVTEAPTMEWQLQLFRK